ncbi:MAG: class I SAM-dependent methyltransferase [Candidatus Omnitrophica bacterium]|nr:class I SAM-dependent methyltransferase [Candidatus Omnitrophota bacterium]MDD5353399.1 class I SAM-dependent methyltransferase [Candidatus Omnitrophota bacterium]MDD5591925.1 class I SAM-dependent methyltransferase [Candidatus Omnitrophota bacterium]
MSLDLRLLFSNHLYIGKKLELERVKKFCPLLKGNVLDIGCGEKPYKRFLGKDSRYFGMEYQEYSRKPDVFGNANKLPFKDMVFDAVLFNEVIEHIPDPNIGLGEIYRVLKKDGKLFLTAPMYWRLHYVPQDYFRFTNYGLTYILENNNFRILEIERMGGFFSIVFIRLIDIFVTKIFFKFASFLSVERGKYRLAALLMSPFSFIGYYLGRFLDMLDKDDAFQWAVFAVKK